MRKLTISLDPSETPFCLDVTLSCGQVFRWLKVKNWWYGFIDGEAVSLSQDKEGTLTLETDSETLGEEELCFYFRFDDNLPEILDSIWRDNYVGEAIKSFRGLRVIRQDPWECLISFICATYSSIDRIQKMLDRLTGRFGKTTRFKRHLLRTFPTPRDLAEAEVADLRRCGLGFRAERVKESSLLVLEGLIDLDSLKKMSYGEAKRELLDLPGVGEKVSDCILLFSLEKLEAFPVDVWMKRALLMNYPNYFGREFRERTHGNKSLSKREYGIFSSFGRSYFGIYAGYAQEYLYHRIRQDWLKLKRSMEKSRCP